jgi:hypothetical protein
MRSLDDVYGRMGDLPFTAEFKYDGQRVQIHAVKAKDRKTFCQPVFQAFGGHDRKGLLHIYH